MNTANDDDRNAIEDLLPWHAAGTLGMRDTQAVEAALARDPELARRFELVREEMDETIHLNESLGAPSARAMQALFAKIDAEPARTGAPALNIGARVAEFFASLSPRTLAFSAGAAALAIVLQAAVIGGFALRENGSTSYQTASAPAETTANTELVIHFKPQATSADITKFLESNNLTLAGGPSAGGLYRVRLAGNKLPPAEVTRKIKVLQIDPVIDLIAAPQ
jgi:hypothetical protein